MYGLEIKPEADKKFHKLSKKNRKQLDIINKKILEIRANPNHIYKFLHKPYQGLNRVHINSHFVLIFGMDHEKQIVTICDFTHHDEAYKP